MRTRVRRAIQIGRALGVVALAHASMAAQPALAQRVEHCVRRLAVDEQREAAIDELVALGKPGVAVLLEHLAALTDLRDTATDRTVDGILRALAAVGSDAAAAAPVLKGLVAEPARHANWQVAWWALGRVLPGGRSPDAAWAAAWAPHAPYATAEIAIGRIHYGSDPEAGLVRALLEGDHLERAVGAGYVARCLATAPDLEAPLLALFRGEFTRRRELREWELWVFAELACGVAALPGRPDEQLLAQVARLLHPDPRERRLAAVALRSYGPLVEPFVADLAGALDDPCGDVVREAALTAGDLGAAGVAFVPMLRECARAPRADVARAARTALARLEADHARARSDPAVRAVASFLDAAEEERAALREGLPHTPAAARALALSLHGWRGEQAAAIRRDVLEALRGMAAATVEQVPVLLEFASHASADDAAGVFAVLQAIGPAAARIPDLRERVESAAAAAVAPSLEAMTEALAAILLPAVRSGERLARFLSDPNPALRLRAVEAMGRLPELAEPERAALAAAMVAEHPTHVRMERARGHDLQWHALAGDEIGLAAARVLVAAGGASPEQVRAAAVRLLDGEPDDCCASLRRLPAAGGFGPELAAVRACLRRGRTAIVLAAIAALGRGGASAVGAVDELRGLTGTDDEVGRAATAAVAAITGRAR